MDAEYPDLFQNTTGNIVKVAVTHNLAIDEMDCVEILPSQGWTGLLNEEDANFFSSSDFNSFYSCFPQINAGSMNMSNFVGLVFYPFENRIMNLYFEGIEGIEDMDIENFKSSISLLAKRFVQIIETSTAVKVEIKDGMLSSVYLAPISAKHWTDKY